MTDQAALTPKRGLMRLQITQRFALHMVATALQQQVLPLKTVDGAELMVERILWVLVQLAR